jgi:hypothetical protein
MVLTALEAMSGCKRPNGWLVIRTSTDGEDIVVAIEDSAMGTDMADLERVFNNSGGGATFAFTLPVDPQ